MSEHERLVVGQQQTAPYVVAEPKRIDAARWPVADNGDLHGWQYHVPTETIPPLSDGALLANDYFAEADIQQMFDSAVADHRATVANWVPEAHDNARTALFEALTASGHLSTVRFQNEAEVANQHCLERLLNGLAQSLPSWELRRRMAEVKEEIIIHLVFAAITRGELPADTMVVTMSDYPDQVSDKQALAMGYRARNRKGFSRATYFTQNADGHWLRQVEQLSRSDSSDGSSARVIKQMTGKPLVGGTDSVAVLSSPMLATREQLPDGVVTLQQHLDATRGDGYRYGNEPSQVTDMHPQYDQVRAVSQERERKVARFIGPLVVAEQQLNSDLNDGRITYAQKLRSYSRLVEKAINEICFLQPEYALEARGKQSAALFVKAHHDYFVLGDRQAANQAYQHAQLLVEAGMAVLCGGGGEETLDAAPSLTANEVSKATDPELVVYRPGYCRIASCVSEGVLTEVGDCNICRDCARRFDSGELK